MGIVALSVLSLPMGEGSGGLRLHSVVGGRACGDPVHIRKSINVTCFKYRATLFCRVHMSLLSIRRLHCRRTKRPQHVRRRLLDFFGVRRLRHSNDRLCPYRRRHEVLGFAKSENKVELSWDARQYCRLQPLSRRVPINCTVRECREELCLDPEHTRKILKACGTASCSMTETDFGQPGCQNQMQFLCVNGILLSMSFRALVTVRVERSVS